MIQLDHAILMLYEHVAVVALAHWPELVEVHLERRSLKELVAKAPRGGDADVEKVRVICAAAPERQG